MSDLNPALVLFKPQEIRRRAEEMLRLAAAGELTHVKADLSRLEAALITVLEVTRENYPDLQIPPYGIWRAFEAGGIDRWAAVAEVREFKTAAEMLAASADLALVGCFMQTFRPRKWSFRDPVTGTAAVGRQASALAAFHMFAGGAFSADMSDPFRVDAQTLIRMEMDELATGLQWDRQEDAELLEAMQRHLKRLGEALALRPDLFSQGSDTRPGVLAMRLGAQAVEAVSAEGLLDSLLASLAPVWDGGAHEDDIMLGDCFRHSGSQGSAEDANYPFHLTAQEMVYSMLEPFAWAGTEVTSLEALTGPADELHAALFMGTGVLEVRDLEQEPETRAAQDRMIELRAVTCALTDRLADRLRQELDVPAQQLPLSCILEGGTSRAGDRILQREAAEYKKLGHDLNPGSVFWLPFGA